jgi:hypothetical protein
MKPKDTTNDAHKVMVEIYRKMSFPDKTERFFDACRTGQLLTMAGLREANPDADEKQIWTLWAKKHLGDELFDKAYGNLKNE